MEKEYIKKIEELNDYTDIYERFVLFFKDCSTYQGYCVTTNKQFIYVLVEDIQSCCENFGYISSCDDENLYVGAELIGIEIVDKELNVEKWNTEVGDLQDGSAIFANFITDRGTFQLTVYNSHNGYYGHEAKFISRDVNLESSI